LSTVNSGVCELAEYTANVKVKRKRKGFIITIGKQLPIYICLYNSDARQLQGASEHTPGNSNSLSIFGAWGWQKQKLACLENNFRRFNRRSSKLPEKSAWVW
jgi:hypothetical protein